MRPGRGIADAFPDPASQVAARLADKEGMDCSCAAVVSCGLPPGLGRPGGGRSPAAAACAPRPWWARWSVWSLLCLVVAWPGRAWDVGRMEQAAANHGPQAVAGVRDLHALLRAASEMAEPDQLEAVNRFFNQRIRFAEDLHVWQQADHWASPVELLHRGRGDCEDYALAKYFTLRALGVPVDRMRLVYVRALLAGAGAAASTVQAHMVLVVYAPGRDAGAADPLVLDNLEATVRPASARSDLTPVFSFNGQGLWQGTGPERAGDPMARLSRWREVAAKASDEGFGP